MCEYYVLHTTESFMYISVKFNASDVQSICVAARNKFPKPSCEYTTIIRRYPFYRFVVGPEARENSVRKPNASKMSATFSPLLCCAGRWIHGVAARVCAKTRLSERRLAAGGLAHIRVRRVSNVRSVLICSRKYYTDISIQCGIIIERTLSRILL